MQLIRTSLAKSETFYITDNKSTADILWMYDHFSAFSSIASTGQFINQFPGEVSFLLFLSSFFNFFFQFFSFIYYFIVKFVLYYF